MREYSQIGTNTTYSKHSFISNEGIRLPASSAPQRRVPYDCQIPLHAIYIIIQSAVYRTWMGAFLFDVERLVLKIISYPTGKEDYYSTVCPRLQCEERCRRIWDICPLQVPQTQVNGVSNTNTVIGLSVNSHIK